MILPGFADLRDALSGVGDSALQLPRVQETGAQMIPFPKRS
jgi:hypothetical protein